MFKGKLYVLVNVFENYSTAVDDGEIWILGSRFPQGRGLSVTWYDKTKAAHDCHGLNVKDPDVKVSMESIISL